MSSLSSHELVVLFLSLGVLLGAARLLGELAQRMHQPAVLGELLAGVLLGPTVLGRFAPDVSRFLFPAEGPGKIALVSITTLAIVMFLLVAGMEVDLSTVFRQGRVALKVGIAGIVVPFLLGLLAAWVAPEALNRPHDSKPLVFVLFVATALAISALPVIARTLMDLGLYRTDLGMIVVSAAIFNDLIGWTIFAVVLGMMEGGPSHHFSVPTTIGLTLGFVAFILTLGRWLIHRSLPYLQAYTQWPAGVLAFSMSLALMAAAFTEWIGIHAIFGSFLVGVAIGDSSHLRERTRVTIEQFVSFIFAPVFFASIGLKVDFVAEFQPLLVAIILVIACLGKLAGAYWGARWGGLDRPNAWAVGFAMNARGAMEIILGLLALEAGVIEKPLFVALVVMALVTSMISGPFMQWVLGHRKPRRLAGLVSSALFVRRLPSVSRREAIHELVALACRSLKIDAEATEAAAWTREETFATGIGNGVALPHARIAGLASPVVVTAMSEAGIDFDAPDGEPAHLLFLILVPKDDPRAQLEISSEIAAIFRDHRHLDQALRTTSFTEFLALLKSAGTERTPSPQSN